MLAQNEKKRTRKWISKKNGFRLWDGDDRVSKDFAHSSIRARCTVNFSFQIRQHKEKQTFSDITKTRSERKKTLFLGCIPDCLHYPYFLSFTRQRYTSIIDAVYMNVSRIFHAPWRAMEKTEEKKTASKHFQCFLLLISGEYTQKWFRFIKKKRYTRCYILAEDIKNIFIDTENSIGIRKEKRIERKRSGRGSKELLDGKKNFCAAVKSNLKKTDYINPFSPLPHQRDATSRQHQQKQFFFTYSRLSVYYHDELISLKRWAVSKSFRFDLPFDSTESELCSREDKTQILKYFNVILNNGFFNSPLSFQFL